MWLSVQQTIANLSVKTEEGMQKGWVQMSELEDHGISQGDHNIGTWKSRLARERTLEMGP